MEQVAALKTLEQFQICSMAHLDELEISSVIEDPAAFSNLVEMLQTSNDLARLAKALAP